MVIGFVQGPRSWEQQDRGEHPLNKTNGDTHVGVSTILFLFFTGCGVTGKWESPYTGVGHLSHSRHKKEQVPDVLHEVWGAKGLA